MKLQALGGRGEGVCGALLLALLLLSATAVGALHASAYTPRAGDSFSYSETMTVNNGGGSYSGYTDQTLVTGTENMNGVSGGIVSSSYDYSYQYSSNQGSSTSGSSSGPYMWSADNFTYVNGTDDQVGYTAPIYVWFAMNASLPVGGTFYSLNTQFTVLSKDYSFHLPALDEYVQTIETEGTGQYQRDDSYGVFSASYTWFEYFDPSTGYIVGYNYVEQDSGQGAAGSFTYTDDLYVTSTSYPLTQTSAPPTTSTTTTSGTGVPTLDYVVVGAILIVILLVIAYTTMRRRGRRSSLPEHPPSPPPTQPPGPPSAQPPAPPAAPWGSGIDLGSKPPEQVVIREVAMVNCKFCGALIPTTAETCPRCGAPNK